MSDFSYIEVSIISIWAAASGEQNPLWRGTIQIGAETEAEINEEIFRKFNRVDDADVRFLDDNDYKFPSLSVGDFLIHSGKCWQVAAVGFIEASHYLLTRNLPLDINH